MFVGPLSVSVSVVVQVLGVLGVTVVGVMGVDWAPIVAVVGPATVKVAVTVLEPGDVAGGCSGTVDEGTTTTVDDVREVDVDVPGGGVVVEVLEELV
jgi:hypothetical protein